MKYFYVYKCLCFIYCNAVFKYTKGLDSVLVVNEEAYHNCNKTNPKEALEDGNSVFKFKRSGPFFFISGHDDKCKNGQKLIIIVMAVSHHDHVVHSTNNAPTPAPVPTPGVAMAPSAMLQGFDGHGIRAPAPAPTSGVTSIGFEYSIGFILGLGLIWL